MRIKRFAAVRRSVVATAATVVVAVSVGSSGWADPADDALARMTELSREAERTAEQSYSAEIDLESKLAAQRTAEESERAGSEALALANADLTGYQSAVDQVAVAAYMGGPTGVIGAALRAQSPQQLLDELSVNKTMTTQMSDRVVAFRAAATRADEAARAAEQATSQARTAAQQAANVSATLQATQSRLQAQIAEVEALYRALTPDQRAALADPGPVPAPPPGDPAVVAMPAPLPPAPDAVVPAPDAVVPAPGSGGGASVVQAAMSRLGAPYSWGATGPDAFDCSGLIKWAFLQNGKSLPRSSQALAAGGQPVALSDLQLGDIVTFYSDASHAGIYIGDGNMVHASTYGTPVKVSPISMAPIYNARRY